VVGVNGSDQTLLDLAADALREGLSVLYVTERQEVAPGVLHALAPVAPVARLRVQGVTTPTMGRYADVIVADCSLPGLVRATLLTRLEPGGRLVERDSNSGVVLTDA